MERDKEIFDIIEQENLRQHKGIELIASENFVSDQVMVFLCWATSIALLKSLTSSSLRPISNIGVALSKKPFNTFLSIFVPLNPIQYCVQPVLTSG